MESIPVILIYDIGKTNKKLLVFDQDYTVVDIRYFEAEQIQDENGFVSEDIISLRNCILALTTDFIKNKNWAVKAINFTAYGATLVNTNSVNELAHIVTNYLNPFNDDLLVEFKNTHDSKDLLSTETASPILGNLNAALQLYTLKKNNPLLFQKIKYSTYLPQYLSSILTNQFFSELTSIGCHTLSWNFEQNNYHQWIKEESIDIKFPPFKSANESLAIVFNNTPLFVGIGLHDSSSALIPYLMTIPHPFMLLSTGSWNICLNPFNRQPLTNTELHHDCLCYLTVDGTPVKASRLNAGFIHENILDKLSIHFKCKREDYLSVSYDRRLKNKIEQKFKEEIILNSHFKPSDWVNYQEAYTAAIFFIVEQQFEKIQLVNSETIKHIYVDGGFSKNDLFMHMLKDKLSGYHLLAAEVGQSTALGAAIVLHHFWNQKNIPNNLIQMRSYEQQH